MLVRLLCALLFAFGWLNCAIAVAQEPTPIVLWHGMGDSCCLPFSLGAVKRLLERELSGVYVKSLKIGGSIITDYESGFFMHPDKQIDYVCKELAQDARLANGYNAIGFSQGGQFLRAVAQRCPNPQPKVLISLGGQHQGIFGLPKCAAMKKESCEYIRKLLTHAAYNELVQRDLVQATYWHDPLHEDKYRERSTFLSDINNELKPNLDYVKNLNKLEKLVLVKFLNDTIVQPRESQWFEFYAPGQDVDIMPLKQSALYQRLGLKALNEAGKLIFLSVEGDHLQVSDKWIVDNLVPLLKNNTAEHRRQ